MHEVNTTAVTCETIIHYIEQMEDHFLKMDISSFMSVWASLEPEMEFLKEINPVKEVENSKIILLTCYKMMICISMSHSIELFVANIMGENVSVSKYESSLRDIMTEAFVICDLNKETSEINKAVFIETFNELMRVTK